MQRHILLVDDNPNDVELALAALDDRTSQEIIVAGSGQDALNLLTQPGTAHPDLILLDLNMPHMDGLDVLDALKSNPELRNIPVIMLTTSAEDSDISACYAHGATAYVVKPLDLTQFRDTLDSIVHFWTDVNRFPGQH